MDIISRIEIKHFRSFDGGKDQPKVRIDDLKDLNVFSGANDSGKSNVLRALNLFFNNEITPGIPFNKVRDFSKIASIRFDKDIEERKLKQLEKIKESGGTEKTRDLRRSDEVVTIKLFFNNKKKQRGLPINFWISKTYSQKNNFQGEYNYQSDLNKAQTTAFLNSFRFEYIPAIKDRNYFNYLFGRLQNYLFEKSDRSKKKNKFTESSDRFNEILRNETENLFNKFMESSGVEANFHIPSTLVDFFRTLSVQTENDISLFERGDGVQARFIPEILDEISSNSSKNVIWGFEEPENSYEAKNIRKLKDEFLFKYSRPFQIFLTTHTKEFLALKREYTSKEKGILSNKKLNTKQKKDDALVKLKLEESSSDVAIYRVWKGLETLNTSQITRYNESNSTWEDICDDLGIIQEARIIDDLQIKLDNQLKELQSSTLNVSQQKNIYKELEEEYKKCLSKLEGANSKIEEYIKPILVVEDKYEAIYKIAYLKCKGITFEKDTLDDLFNQHSNFVIRRAEGAGSVVGFLSMNNTDGYTDKKVIGLFDYDEEGCKSFYLLKGKANKAWQDEILGEKKTGYYRYRKDHKHFFALLLPIPDRLNSITSEVKDKVFASCVEIENLITEQKLIDLNCVQEKSIFDKKYYKIKDKIKSKAFDKFGGLPSIDFEDFTPLFNQIDFLFKEK